MPNSEYPELCLGSDIHFDDLCEFMESALDELSVKRGGPQLLGLFNQSKLKSHFLDIANEDIFFRGILWEGNLGGLIWAELYHNNLDQRFCVINALIVRKDLRGKGFGKQLYIGCEKWSADKGSKGIEIQVLPGDRHSKNFCESRGLVARSLIMHKPLGS